MNTYQTPGGDVVELRFCGLVTQDMYADLVAAIHIARAFEAKCERLEAMLESAGDLAHNLQEENDNLRHLVGSLRRELDRLELVS